jgi:ADP-ribose pyrophosphatase YjhB (NUDIX family)
MPPNVRPMIRIAAVALLREDHVLLVRKKRTDLFMLPGGKFELDETALDVASRELQEELGICLAPQTMDILGSFVAQAANEPGHNVMAIVFVAKLPETLGPKPQAEIAECRFEHLDSLAPDLAPLVSDEVLPALRRHATRIKA